MEGIRLNEAKHESYLQLWRGRVMECRNSGKPVAVWCEEQGINIKTYYYWQKQVWDKTANTIIPNGQSNSPQIRPVQFAQVNLVPDKTSTGGDQKCLIFPKLRRSILRLGIAISDVVSMDLLQLSRTHSI